MEVADEPVAEGSEGLVVEVTCGSSVVVELAAAGACRDRTECPLVDGVVEAPVADMAGEHGVLLARGDGGVESGDDLDQRFRCCSERCGDRWRGGELRGPQRGLAFGSTPVEVPLASAALQRGADLGDRQLSGLVGVLRFGEHCDCVAASAFVVRDQCGGERLAEIVGEPVGVL